VYGIGCCRFGAKVRTDASGETRAQFHDRQSVDEKGKLITIMQCSMRTRVFYNRWWSLVSASVETLAMATEQCEEHVRELTKVLSYTA